MKAEERVSLPMTSRPATKGVRAAKTDAKRGFKARRTGIKRPLRTGIVLGKGLVLSLHSEDEHTRRALPQQQLLAKA